MCCCVRQATASESNSSHPVSAQETDQHAVVLFVGAVCLGGTQLAEEVVSCLMCRSQNSQAEGSECSRWHCEANKDTHSSLQVALSIYQAVRVEDGPLSFFLSSSLSLSLSQMAILLTTVRKLLHSTLHISAEVSGFVDLFELQSLSKSEDLCCFSLELAQKWHFGFFRL